LGTILFFLYSFAASHQIHLTIKFTSNWISRTTPTPTW
jgi:hypothetical protein